MESIGAQVDVSDDSPLQLYLLKYQNLIQKDLKEKIEGAEKMIEKIYLKIESKAAEEFEAMRLVHEFADSYEALIF